MSAFGGFLEEWLCFLMINFKLIKDHRYNEFVEVQYFKI